MKHGVAGIPVLALIALYFACSRNMAPEKVISVASTSELVGATVMLDGQAIGKLEPFLKDNNILDLYLKKRYPSTRAAKTVQFLYFMRGPNLGNGVHKIVVQKEGYATFSENCSFATGSSDEGISIWVPVKRVGEGGKKEKKPAT